MGVTGAKGVWRSLSALLAALCLAVSARPASLKPSQMEQVRLGVRAAAEIRRQEKILPDTDSRVKLVRMVGMRLLACFHDRAPWQWSFDVIDGREINAFALPGGPVFVFTGLLDKLKSEDELAAIMGHEMTHVRKEHWAHMMADEEVRDLGLSILLGVTHASYDMYNTTDFLNSLYSLRFSRGDETAADDGGFQLMSQAGYNPQGMADVFQMLEDAQRGGNDPEFLSDHPSDRHRIARIEGKIAASGVKYPSLSPLAMDGYDRYFAEFYEPAAPKTDASDDPP